MSKRVIVVAPHPDDETIGCGGTLLRHIDEGDSVNWLIVTAMPVSFPTEAIQRRKSEIERVSSKYGFCSTHILGFPTTMLDTIPMSDIVNKISQAFHQIKPEIVYLPFRGDVHTDHRYVFDAVVSCTKWFRYGSIRKVLAYETLSETDFNINPNSQGFRPNVFVNIANYLEQKLEVMQIYETEIGTFPFPRSVQAIRALAALRGAATGVEAAEAFMLLKEIR